MRTVSTLFVALGFLFLTCTSAIDVFGQAAATPPKQDVRKRLQFMSEETLAKLVNTNMSKQQILERFGKPDIDRIPNGGIDVWDFIFDPDDDVGPRRNIASGLTVYWKGDKMVRWAPALGTTGGKPPGEFLKKIEPRGVETDVIKTNLDLSFWLVSQERIEGGRYIDTPEFKKLGWIAKEPALRVGQLKSASAGHEPVNYDGKTPHEEYRFDLALLKADAEAFEKLTGQNRGKQMLMMLGNKPLIAPLVLGPIAEGRFSITVKDQQSFEFLRDGIATLVTKK